MPNWKVGQTYKTRDERSARFLGVIKAPRSLVFAVTMEDGIEYSTMRYENGRIFSPVVEQSSHCDILPPDEATAEERELVARIHEVARCPHFAVQARSVSCDITNQVLYPVSFKVLQIVREIKGTKPSE